MRHADQTELPRYGRKHHSKSRQHQPGRHDPSLQVEWTVKGCTSCRYSRKSALSVSLGVVIFQKSLVEMSTILTSCNFSISVINVSMNSSFAWFATGRKSVSHEMASFHEKHSISAEVHTPIHISSSYMSLQYIAGASKGLARLS